MTIATQLVALAAFGTFAAAATSTVRPLGAQTPACCTITAIIAATGVVSGRVTANGGVFEFKVTDARVLASLKVGQAVYANFTTHQLSVDGRSMCCAVTSGPTVVAPALKPLPSAVVPSSKVPAISLALPTIAYGTPHPPAVTIRDPNLVVARFSTRSIGATVAGRPATGNIMHLRGLDGIENATGLPDGAKRLLQMHVRKLALGEANHYIVNVDLANQWMRDHKVPDHIKPADDHPSTHSGCHKYTWHCVAESAAHIEDQANKIIRDAQDAWNHAGDELTNEWHTVAECFADHTLPLGQIPVQFAIAPGMTVNMATGKVDTTGGQTTTTAVNGSLGLSFPIEGNFNAQLDLFYIPCLPFVVRPRQITADGVLTVGEELKASASASGRFRKVFTIPPTGGPQIPVQVIPIVIGGVPVLELDVSVYIEGNVEVRAQGEVSGQLEIKNPHKAQFNFACNGGGCTGGSRGIPDPSTATESAEIKGRLSIRPDIYTALQLDVDFDALSARAGPQPYLFGEAAGCIGAAGVQIAGGASGTSENHLLAADLDWGVDIRAEALVARKRVGNKYQHSFTGNKHLWWRDLAPAGGSTALDVLVTGVAPAVAKKPASFRVRMPSCYPYTGAVHYQLSWSGQEAVPAPNLACRWQGTGGTCTADPTKDLVIAITWPAAGPQKLTVTAVGDSHDNITREFLPARPPKPVSVTVGPGS